MAVRLEHGVRKNPSASPQAAAPESEAASRAARLPKPLSAQVGRRPEDAVSAEDGLRTARGILFGLAISLAAWACAGLLWWAI